MLLVSIILFIGIIGLHYYFNKDSVLKEYYFLALVLKLFCGVLMYQAYRYFGILGDITAYWIDATRISDLFWNNTHGFTEFVLAGNNPQEGYYIFATKGERAIFFLRYLSITTLLASKNIYLTTLFSSFFAFTGLWACANRLAYFFIHFGKTEAKRVNFAVLGGFFLVPSVTFWSSGMMKESLLWLLMGFLIAFYLDVVGSVLLDERKVGLKLLLKVTSLPILTICLFLLKYYYFAVLVPVLLSYLVALFFRKKAFSIHLSSFILLFIGIVSIVSLFHPNLRFSAIAEVIFNNQNYFFGVSPLDNQIDFHSRAPTIWSMLSNAPQALFSGLFSPLSWESFKLLKLFSVLENWVLLFLFIQTIQVRRFFSKESIFGSSSLRLLWVAGILFCLLMATLLALAAPNVGSLVRYKVGFLPFWVFGILLRVD